MRPSSQVKVESRSDVPNKTDEISHPLRVFLAIEEVRVYLCIRYPIQTSTSGEDVNISAYALDSIVYTYTKDPQTMMSIPPNSWDMGTGGRPDGSMATMIT